MPLTESQEGGKDTDELHCGCGGGSVRRRQNGWIEWRAVERLLALKYTPAVTKTLGRTLSQAAKTETGPLPEKNGIFKDGVQDFGVLLKIIHNVSDYP